MENPRIKMWNCSQLTLKHTPTAREYGTPTAPAKSCCSCNIVLELLHEHHFVCSRSCIMLELSQSWVQELQPVGARAPAHTLPECCTKCARAPAPKCSSSCIMSELLHVNEDGAPTLLQQLLQFGARALEIWCRSCSTIYRSPGARRALTVVSYSRDQGVRT